MKALGGTKSTARTADQTDAVTFWRNANFGPSWQAAARQLATSKELGLPNVPACSRCSTWAWPTTTSSIGMRSTPTISGGLSPRSATATWTATTPPSATPAWTPLNMTPLHPEYPSQATINATVASAILESVFGPVRPLPFTVTDIADPKRTRQFKNIADMVEEQKNVRVWGGVHFRTALMSVRTWAARSRPHDRELAQAGTLTA